MKEGRKTTTAGEIVEKPKNERSKRMKTITMVMLCVVLVAALFVVGVPGTLVYGADVPAPQQLPGEHSTLCTSDGSIRDDELADYIANKIPQDGDGVPQVHDVKIMFNSCYGGGFADDFERIFGPGGACEGVPWVFGSASGADEPAEGWADGDNTDNGFGSCWSDALAGADSSPTNPTPGSIRDGTSNNVQEDFEAARDNDDSGPDYDDSEHPVVASGNGGGSIQWNSTTSHEAVVFGGSQTDQRHHNNVDNVEEALEGVWADDSCNIQKIDGGTTQDLKDAIDDACANLDSDTQLVLYFDDHGDTEFDLDEFLKWMLPYTIFELESIEFDLHPGWEEGLTGMHNQGDNPSPFITLELVEPIYSEEWSILLNEVAIPLPAGNLTGTLELPVDWQSIYTGSNALEIFSINASGPMVLNNLELCSGPINEIEKQSADGTGEGYYLLIDMPGNTSEYRISQSGNLEQPAEVSSEDGAITISLGEGTACLDKDGKKLESILVSEETDLPALPENYYFVSKAYKAEPEGATFDPSLNLTLSYEDDAIPENVPEAGIYIASYNATSESWVSLTSQVDTQNNTVTAPVSHFSTFAVMGTATPPPAEFTITSLDLSSEQVKPGQEVIASVNVTNTGGSEGSYTVNLTINGEVEQTRTVTLAPQATETVAFTITKEEPGSYSVSIGDLTDEFTVTASWLSRYWWTIVVGIIIAGLLVYFLLFRRKRARPTTAK